MFVYHTIQSYAYNCRRPYGQKFPNEITTFSQVTKINFILLKLL